MGCARLHRLTVGLARISLIAVAFAAALAPSRAGAQIPANESWHTIQTAHFRVHFTAPLETQARHAAAVAERAYSNLATELVTPRGPIDIVVSDATDASNGSATVVPRPVVLIYARPPVDEPSLESYEDWTVLVLQHELTHIFHLDRSRGWWSAAQAVFGRNPVLFPNYYTPSWLTEGLAVYYESRFTSGGRLLGSFETAVARSAAIDRVLPSLGQLSLATSRFPYGESVYVYGSFVWDDLSRRHGPASVPAFVERSSEEPVPFLLDREAKRTFGETFTRAWKEWRDSVLRSVNDSSLYALQSAATPPGFAASDALVIPNGGRSIMEPRWISDSTLIFVANNGRQSPALYRTSIRGTPNRIARRNSLDVNDPAPDGSIVFSQDDYVDRYHVRGDLYVRRDGVETRLTHGARLSEPSVRADGEIVAVQTVPGTTRLVRVSRDGASIVPITTAALDTQWTAPRWSPDGQRIVAVRITGASNEVVVLDSTGRVLAVPVREHAVLRSPAWMDDARSLVFASDSSGAPQLYAASVDGANMRRLTAEPGGVYGADVVRSVDGYVRVATTVLRGDGYHLLVWTVPAGTLTVAENAATGADTSQSAEQHVEMPDPRWRVADDTSEERGYSPWRTLVPAYWSPTLAQEGSGRGNVIGALTGASDVIGRHSYIAQAAVNTHNSNVDASLDYSYNRWLNPVLSASLEQSWSYSDITSGGRKIGDLDRRSRFGSLHATFVRPRVRTYSAVMFGAQYEERDYSSSPDALLPRLNSFYSMQHRYPAVVASAVFSNTQRPTLSISPEDGVAFTASLQQRWESSNAGTDRSATAVGYVYKSLDLPGFAHHVIAVRAAVGSADARSPSEYDVGGVNGSSVEIVPGINFGSPSRTFPVRGFPSGAEAGIHAVSATAEYRMPLGAPSGSLGLFPFFLDRASLAFFADAGRAACPASSMPACSPSDTNGPTLASVGAELNLDTALQFDVPYRFRLGLAHPVHGAAYGAASRLSAYATLGLNY